MNTMVTSYHPTVARTGSTIEGLIAGTSCFPGGTGLWRGERNGGMLPQCFPIHPVMFVAHNFDSQRAYDISSANNGEAQGQFWQRLIGLLRGANLSPSECFFTNALMGLKPGSATGTMPSVAGYKDQCGLFLARQVEIVQPRAVIALGVKAEKYVCKLRAHWMAIRHPSDWHFRDLDTRVQRLREEGGGIRDFLTGSSIEEQATAKANAGILRCAQNDKRRG